MAVVIVRSDFGAQENKICHCFHFPSNYLPVSLVAASAGHPLVVVFRLLIAVASLVEEQGV